MKSTERIDTSNREMVTISRARYEAMQAHLARQNQQLEVKNAELASQGAELAQANDVQLAAERI